MISGASAAESRRSGEFAAARTVLLAAVLTAILIRGFPLFAHASPTGGDYGHLMHHARLYLETGRVPEVAPFFQLGETRFAVLPGASALFALVAAVAARDPIACAPFVLLLAAIEVVGIFLLARRVVQREDAAAAAAAVAALLPSGASMTAWSAYGNLTALAFMPFALLAWLEYWDAPSPRTLCVAALVIAGAASVHHLSSAVLGLSLILFSIGAMVVMPREALVRLVPLAVAGFVAGLPTLAAMGDLARELGGDLATASRYDYWRIDWAVGARVASPLCLVFLAGGMLRVVRDPRLRRADRALLACYLTVILALSFGWLVGLHLYYMRMLFFLPVVSAIGAAALVVSWRSAAGRGVVALALTVALGIPTLFESQGQAAYFEIMKPGVRAGLEWTREHSTASDVVVVSSLLGFHAPSILERPTMAAMPPDLIGNPAELPIAADASSVLAGHPTMDSVLTGRSVRFIVVTMRLDDAPDSYRSRAVLSGHPRMKLRFQNEDVQVFEVSS